MNGSKTSPYIELPVFQGPLDLLLHLIQQHKLDIYDIPIASIADQFIATVRLMEKMDMDVTSEFLVLAAQLLFLKSSSLLPKSKKNDEIILEEEEMKQNLIERLVAYRDYKLAAGILAEKETISGMKYFREPSEEEIMSFLKLPNPLEGIELDSIVKAFQEILVKAEQGEDIQFIQIEEVPLELMIRDILKRIILHPKGVSFKQLLRLHTRIEIIIAFLSLLELLKDGIIRSEQSGTANDFFLVPTEKAWDFIEEESV
ncbi:condensin subunit ScpA [Syntrophobotulus glycolicus DSM 8271]|uniref:Segregation and condensation protein A n=1 Tax=Syntrophobotulus glycolicus (strain DSM 8271 / FlGlyR) TaxID=645991 RepID=F0T064_SYNGF|nr:segregation/condensation protein A [Syntrophobotulus glycolicus]ADY56151.1 condensin subunit ScpA [Syntrophobotulus glycolicus DSM 8271]